MYSQMFLFITWQMHMQPTEYTDSYLEGLRLRFPEFATVTKQELITALQANNNREQGSYEFFIKDALDAANQEVSLNYPDESLFSYLFEELPEEEASRIQQGIVHVVTWSGAWDLVLGAWTGPKSQDRATTIWHPTFVDDHTFIQTGKEPYFTRWDENKYVVTLSIKRTWAEDVYWRKMYTIAPQLIQVPDKWAMIMDGMLFKKDLNVAEFKENFAKCDKPDNQN